MHKGMMMEAVRIEGQAGHSSDPSLGANALEAMHGVMSELLTIRAELQANYQNAGFKVNVPTMNFGCIHGGDNPNRICGRCEMEFDLRPLPGMSMDSLRNMISERLHPIEAKHNVQLTTRSLFPGIPPYEQSEQSDLIRQVERLTGHNAQSVAFGTEAPFLQSLGMETVVLGPGSINQAHQPNEYIDTSQIEPAIDIVSRLIEQY